MSEFRTLIPSEMLHRRIGELAGLVAERYPDTPPCFVSVMEGARVFTRHLLRQLPWRPPVHEIRASSYGAGTESSGDVQIVDGAAIPVQGQRVLLIEDIVDTGRTVHHLDGHLLAQGAVDVTVATLLSKPSRRVVDVALDFVGFEIPDEFVIGFGMDVAGRYRELDHVAIYESDGLAAEA